MTQPARQPHEIALRQWLADTMGIPVNFSHPDAPRDARPYGSFQILTDTSREMRAEVETTDTPSAVPAEFVEVLCQPRLFTFSVQVYADNARTLLRDLRLALSLSTSIEYFGANSVHVLRPLTAVIDQRTARGVQWEPWAVIDFEGTYVASLSGSVAIIESVNVTSTAGDLAGFDETYTG